MKVTQEKLPASQISLEIEIPIEKSQHTYEQVIQKFARSANIPGFRKGKVPRQILLQRLGLAQIKAAALEELVQSGLTEAIKQSEIQVIGQPQLRSSFEDLVNQYEPGKPLTFLAAVDVQPEVNLAQYSGLKVQAEEVKYNPASVEKVLEENRTEMATLVPVEGRAAQVGDVAVVDFKGHFVNESEATELPQEIPGATATDFQVELLEGRFIEGFIDGIIGMNPEETKEVAAKFPEDYPQKDLAGKAAVFTVTLKELKEKELPELDDDFAQEASEFETLEELRASLESRFHAEAESKTKVNKEQALSDELLKHIEVELPETMIAEEVDAMLTQTAVQLSNQGIDVKKLFTPRKYTSVERAIAPRSSRASEAITGAARSG
jgi:trigger factor